MEDFSLEFMTLERRSQCTQEITKAMNILYDTLEDHCTFTRFAGEFFTVFKIAAIKFSYKAIPSLESSITFSFLISLLWETFRDRAPKERKIPAPFAREIAPAVSQREPLADVAGKIELNENCFDGSFGCMDFRAMTMGLVKF